MLGFHAGGVDPSFHLETTVVTAVYVGFSRETGVSMEHGLNERSAHMFSMGLPYMPPQTDPIGSPNWQSQTGRVWGGTSTVGDFQVLQVGFRRSRILRVWRLL